MPLDKGTILQNAQKFTAKGQIDRAIEEWQKLIQETPNDGNIYNTIGDLNLKKNRHDAAIEAYLHAAQAFEQAGFSLKTIAVYKKVIKIDPDRIEIIAKLADLNADRGLAGNAIEDYLRVAKAYNKRGEIKESLEIYKKIAALDPSNTGLCTKLAEMCRKEGYLEDAAEQYLKVAEHHLRKGDTAAARDVYKTILSFDPKNEAAQKGLKPSGSFPESMVDSEIAVLPEPSFEEQLTAVDKWLKEGALSKAEKTLSLLAAVNPGDPDLLERQFRVSLSLMRIDDAYKIGVSLSEAFLRDHRVDDAERILREYIAIDDERAEIHRRLGGLIEKRGDVERAVEAYARAISLYETAGDDEKALSLYEKAIELQPAAVCLEPHRARFNPPNEIAMLSTGARKEATPGTASDDLDVGTLETDAVEVLSEEPENIVVEDSGSSPTPELERATPEPVTSSASGAEDSTVLDVAERETKEPAAQDVAPAETFLEPEEEIPAAIPETASNQDAELLMIEEREMLERCFTEAEVYLKYGLVTKAIEQLKQVITLAPHHLDARLRLKDIYALEGNLKEAASQCMALAKIYKEAGSLSKVQEMLDLARTYSPEAINSEARTQGDVSQPETVTDEVSAGAPPAEEASRYELDFDLGLGDDPSAEAASRGSVEHHTDAEREESSGDEEDPLAEVVAEAEFYLQQGLLEEAKATYQRILTVNPGHVLAAARVRELAGVDEKREREPYRIDPPSALEDIPPGVSEEAPSAEESFADLAMEDPLEVFEQSAKSTDSVTPGSPSPEDQFDADRTGDRTADLEEALRDPGSAVGFESGGSEEYVDLTKMVFDDIVEAASPEPAEEPASEIDAELDSIFQEFQKGVRDQCGDEDYETHYDLGIAYREMGLIQEAIVEFRLAAKGDGRSIDARLMLAACQRDRGALDAAVAVLLDTLTDPRCTGEASLAVRYDLASAYAAQGKEKEAARLYQSIASEDPTFRDAQAKGRQSGGRRDMATSSARGGEGKPAESRKWKKVSYL